MYIKTARNFTSSEHVVPCKHVQISESKMDYKMNYLFVKVMQLSLS